MKDIIAVTHATAITMGIYYAASMPAIAVLVRLGGIL